MKIEITNVSVSKKGTCWIQAKILATQDTHTPSPGQIYDCERKDKEEETKSEKD